ncbi:MAG: hypothetical protein KIT83_04615 [Bryobacterales bacterium]|nr:hypothetical protein [Bryobacterales bacterium]
MTAEQTNPDADAPAVDFTRYRVLVAGEFSASVKQWAGLTELGVRVTVLGKATPPVQRKMDQLGLEECLFVDDRSRLEEEAYARWTGYDLVVLLGSPANALEALLLPWMEEAAASSLQPLLPLVRLDDPALRFLRTGEQWAFFLLGRTLGLGSRRARAFMEECCGYPKQNR